MPDNCYDFAVNDRVRYESQGRQRSGTVTALRAGDASGCAEAAVAPFDGGPRVWLSVTRLRPTTAS